MGETVCVVTNRELCGGWHKEGRRLGKFGSGKCWVNCVARKARTGLRHLVRMYPWKARSGEVWMSRL